MAKRSIISKRIEEIYRDREKIIFPDYQREPRLWQTKDKQLLIDSIYRDIDIPKLYFYLNENKQYEVVDGQQRLWAIWEYIDNVYSYCIGGKSKHFKDLTLRERDILLNYTLQIVCITSVDDEYLRELFLRLQFGLLLITGEKLHALSGTMRDYIFKTMVNHPFIKSVNIPRRRFARQTLCAQICINSFTYAKNREYARTRYGDLKTFFDYYKLPKGEDALYFNERIGSINKVLDKLHKSFHLNAGLLKNRSFILTIYLYVEKILKQSSAKSAILLPDFVKFINKLWARIKEESKKDPFHRKNEHLYAFESYLNNAPGEKYQIFNRDKKLNEFFNYYRNNKGKILGD